MMTTSLNKELNILSKSNRKTFEELYTEGKSSLYNPEKMINQLRFGLLCKTNNGKVKSRYRIYIYSGNFFLTDFKDESEDQVFSPYDEEVFLCAPFYTAEINKNNQILEIGTGCGIYSILSAKKGAQVTSIDINRKAIQYAKLNEKINIGKPVIQFECTDIDNFIGKNLQFDLVIASLPYMPVYPSKKSNKIYSNGGKYGCKHLIKAIKQAHILLKPYGVFKMYAMSLGNYNSSYMEQNITSLINVKNMGIKINKLYKDPFNFIEWYNNKFQSVSNETLNWLDDLEKRNLQYMHYMTIELHNSIYKNVEITQTRYDKCIPYPKSKNLMEKIRDLE